MKNALRDPRSHACLRSVYKLPLFAVTFINFGVLSFDVRSLGHNLLWEKQIPQSLLLRTYVRGS